MSDESGVGSLTGKVALVTGSGHGIGAETARLFARRGAAVVVNDVVEERATTVAAEIATSGAAAIAVTADVSRPEDVERMISTAVDAFGPVDILVNNAYAQRDREFLEYSIEEWDLLFSVIVRGTYLCSRAVLPEMIDRGHGNIVNIASIGASLALTKHVAYAASKAAIVGLTRSLAQEVAEHGIRVNAVAPGPTDTKGYPIEPDLIGILVHRLGRPIDIAEAVGFLVSEEASFIIGHTLTVAGGADLRIGHAWKR